MYLGITGASGMLGKAVVEACAEQSVGSITFPHEGFDISYINDARDIAQSAADCIINCAGAIPGKYAPADMVRMNALGPWTLAEFFHKPIIHVSTDCVFSGVYDEPYPVTFNPDPVDLYGRTKLVGEVKADHVLNVRTSFIGFDHGLLNWLCSYSDWSVVEGWEYAFWSGSTVWAVAEQLVKLALNFKGGGIEHLATLEPISKLTLLSYLRSVLDLKVNIKPAVSPMIDRSLKPTVALPSVFDDEVRKDLIQRYNAWKKVPA